MSILPTDMLDPEIPLSQSCWEVESQRSQLQFCFTSSFQQCEKMETPATKQGLDSPCLSSPCDVALLANRRLLLVTEPSLNRIGIYSADDLQFKAWCIYPCIYGQNKKKFYYPTNILRTRNFLFILVKNELLILDDELQPHQPPIKGKFAGLAENEMGDVYTMFNDWKGRTYVKCLRLDTDPWRKEMYGKQYFLWHGDKVLLSVVEKFQGWESHSKCWFLTAKGSNLYITDTGLSKVYILDLKTGLQSAFGLLGSNEDQLKAPTGILTDEQGNLLVCDSGNDRLVVYDEAGSFLKVAESNEFSTPFGMVRHENTIVVVYQGNTSQRRASLVRYRTTQEIK